MRNTASRHAASICAFDALESRALLSASFEFVGIDYGEGGPMLLQQGAGIIADDGSVTGSVMAVGAAGAVTTMPTTYDKAELGPAGRFTMTARLGLPPLADRAGSSPFNSLGYPAGFHSARYATEAGMRELDAFMIEQAPDFGAWNGTWELRRLVLTADGTRIEAGSLTFIVSDASTPVAVEWSESGGAPVRKAVASFSSEGIVTLESGERLMMAHDFNNRANGTFLLVSELGNSDGEVSIAVGSAIRLFSAHSSANFFGVYRASVLTSGPLGAALFGAASTAQPAAVQVVIDLADDGAMTMYECRAYDQGDRTPVLSGTWRMSVLPFDTDRFGTERVLLEDTVTRVTASFLATIDFGFVAQSVVSLDDRPREEIFGVMATYMPLWTERYGSTITVGIDAGGRPVVYQTRQVAEDVPDPWYSIDLISAVGGKTVREVTLVSQHPGADDLVCMIAGVAQDGDAVVWERDWRGKWTFRDLTEELAADGAEPIAPLTGTIFSTTMNDWRNVAYTGLKADVPIIAARNVAGEIGIYQPELSQHEYARTRWQFVKVQPYGEDVPEFISRPVGYGTAWGGMNIASLDQNGHLQVAWWAPGLRDWYVSDLSEIAGTPALAGSVTVYTTQWAAIHVNAISADGRLVVTWWAPALGGTWYANDLTTDSGGPAVAASRELAFFGNGLNLNLVAYDTQGNIVVYWWHPGAPGWLIGDLTVSVPTDERPLRITGADASALSGRIRQNVYGTAAEGGLLRLYWESDARDEWRIQNLTDIAIMLPA
ncbi:MAG: hypothetical protein IT436_11375 [Phycisphaerales bacterium]|nr:hypothetical protein [Phycisphaerales bacterium]